MSDEPKTGRLEIRVPEALINAIEKWRLRQTVPPSRSAAIRYLIESGLTVQSGGSGGSTPGSAPKPASADKSAAPRAKKPTASDRQATSPSSKEAQIRALREHSTQ